MSARRARAGAPVTDEQRRLAYRQLSRPGWPPFDDLHLPQHHHRAVCVEGLARNLARAQWKPAAMATGLPHGLPVPPTPQAPPVRKPSDASPIIGRWSKRRGIDLKRAAANDVDD